MQHKILRQTCSYNKTEWSFINS